VGEVGVAGEVGEVLRLSPLAGGESPCVYTDVGDRLPLPADVGLGGRRPPAAGPAAAVDECKPCPSPASCAWLACP